jgi:nicotinamide riboside kinase
LEEIKRQSSVWIKTVHPKYQNFYWQDGYGIFSVNPSEVEIVAQYIRNQKHHHAKKSFKDELRAFLKKYAVEYDEKYIWD